MAKIIVFPFVGLSVIGAYVFSGARAWGWHVSLALSLVAVGIMFSGALVSLALESVNILLFGAPAPEPCKEDYTGSAKMPAGWYESSDPATWAGNPQ